MTLLFIVHMGLGPDFPFQKVSALADFECEHFVVALGFDVEVIYEASTAARLPDFNFSERGIFTMLTAMQAAGSQAGQIGVHGRIDVGGAPGKVDGLQVVAGQAAVLPGGVVVSIDEGHFLQDLPGFLD